MVKSYTQILRRVICFSFLSGLLIPAGSSRAAELSDVMSCDQFLVPKTEVNGQMIGQEVCRMTTIEMEFAGRRFMRVDMGVTGTLEGYTLKNNDARYSNYFNRYPEFVYAQGGEEDEEVFHGIGRYEID